MPAPFATTPDFKSLQNFRLEPRSEALHTFQAIGAHCFFERSECRDTQLAAPWEAIAQGKVLAPAARATSFRG